MFGGGFIARETCHKMPKIYRAGTLGLELDVEDPRLIFTDLAVLPASVLSYHKLPVTYGYTHSRKHV